MVGLLAVQSLICRNTPSIPMLFSDMVAVCGETTAGQALQTMHKKMLRDRTGRRILKDKPRISSSNIDMKILKSLPQNTFGRQYVDMLKKYVSWPLQEIQ